MKAVLTVLNAKYIHSSLAIRSIATYAKHHDVSIVEHTVNEDIRDVFADLYKRDACVFGFSCYIWNIQKTFEVAMLLKKARPNVMVLFGGPEAYGQGKLLLQTNPCIDAIIAGEGEKVFSDCLNALEKGEDFSAVSGVIYRDEKGKIRENPVGELLSMDELPFAYNEETLFDLQDKLVYYESSRGCPFGCSYCMSSVEKTVRFRSLELVFGELQFFLDHHVPIVKLVDRTFNCDRSRAEAIFQYLIEHQNRTLFHFEISADLLTDEIFDVLKTAPEGLFQFEIGIQSTSPDTLKAVHRSSNIERCMSNIRRLVLETKIHTHVDLIAGLPSEDIETFRNSFNETYQLGAEMLQLGFLKVLHGSPIESEAEKYGLVYSDLPPYEIIETKTMTASDLLELKCVEKAVDVYYNSGRFRNTLPILVPRFKTPYDCFLALSKKLVGAHSHPSLCDFLWEASKEDSSICFPLAIDFLLENRGKEAPPYLGITHPDGWKKIVREYLEEKHLEDFKDAVKRIRIEPIADKVILLDFDGKTWQDVTDDFVAGSFAKFSKR